MSLVCVCFGTLVFLGLAGMVGGLVWYFMRRAKQERAGGAGGAAANPEEEWADADKSGWDTARKPPPSAPADRDKTDG